MEKRPFNRKSSIPCHQWIPLLDQLDIGTFTIDSRRRITSVNDSARVLMGLENTEVIGKSCLEIFKTFNCFPECPFKKEPISEEENRTLNFRDTREPAPLITRLSTPIHGPDGQITGCLTILQDNSALAGLIRRVNHEERTQKIILDNLDIGIFTVNRGGHITFFNTAAEKITGFDRRQVLGKPAGFIFGEKGASEILHLRESMADGQARTRRKVKIITNLGEQIPIRADYMPLQDEGGETVGGLATMKDLTLAEHFNQVVSKQYTFHNMIGRDPAMQRIFEMVSVVAASNVTVLIEGATGTGKDFLAKVIHSASSRASRPLVKVNCAALPDNLLESEMFGYIKGAFTGADRDKPGRFQEADGGTIFLDEIGDLPLSLQAKLLRVLEDKEFYPLGSRRTVKVDVRIISATNRGLEKLLAKGQFREDLYYRLNVLRMEIPCLKDRRADLPLLIRHLLRKLSAAKEKAQVEISEKAMEILLGYYYPGNVRELENILEHALIICQGDAIECSHLPVNVINWYKYARSYSHPLKVINTETRDNAREKILKTLKQNDWHREKTARALGMDRTTLWRKMKKLGLDT